MEGVGKLIELLNEWYQERYETNPHFNKFEDYGGNDYGYFIGDNNLMVETEVWTKKYGFIKWLVDNDKIEFNNDKMMIPYNEEYKLYVVSYEHLLMILAISDTPIDLLCSLLK